jgi:carboxypeptidase C (cathepsin A)
MFRSMGCAAVAVALWGGAASAQQAAPKKTESPVMVVPSIGKSADQWRIDPQAALPAIAPRHFERARIGSFAGTRMKYRVVAEDTLIPDAAGETIGSIFSFSYLKDGAPAADRPVLFIFNGGPGSASTWLHMGVLGPRKLAMRDITPRQVAPYVLEDNPDSALAVADLVFIDPIGTGFSRYSGKGRPDDVYGREQDAAATVRFVTGWLRAHGRWNSPKFVLGESYGTTRANLVARRLMGGFLDGSLKGVALNGVILVGGDGGLARPTGNDRFLLPFTTMAATAWYHGRVDKAGRSFDAFIADADRFARTVLVPAIDKGEALGAAQTEAIARQHAAFSGLDPAFLVSKGLRIQPSDYVTHLLADTGQVVGFYDSRYVLPAAPTLGDPVADDAAMGQYSTPFIGAFNHYIRDQLGVTIDDDYRVIDWINVNLPWDNKGDLDPGGDLAVMMRRNPDLRLMTIEGWYDMFGAVGTAEYGVAQRGLPRERVTMKAYQSGHMAYVGAAGTQMAADLKAFLIRASKP